MGSLTSQSVDAASATGGVAAKSLPYMQVFAAVTMVLGVGVISFACFLLGRMAFVEIELAARFSGMADALCIAGTDFEQLQKAAEFLVPHAKYLSIPEIFSPKDRESLVDLLKLLLRK